MGSSSSRLSRDTYATSKDRKLAKTLQAHKKNLQDRIFKRDIAALTSKQCDTPSSSGCQLELGEDPEALDEELDRVEEVLIRLSLQRRDQQSAEQDAAGTGTTGATLSQSQQLPPAAPDWDSDVTEWESDSMASDSTDSFYLPPSRASLRRKLRLRSSQIHSDRALAEKLHAQDHARLAAAAALERNDATIANLFAVREERQSVSWMLYVRAMLPAAAGGGGGGKIKIDKKLARESIAYLHETSTWDASGTQEEELQRLGRVAEGRRRRAEEEDARRWCVAEEGGEGRVQEEIEGVFAGRLGSCGVCMEMRDEEDMVRVRQCQHAYCRSCLVDAFEHALTTKTPFTCCNTHVSPTLIPRTTFYATHNRAYTLLLLEHTTPHPQYCSSPPCRSFLPPSSILRDTGTASCMVCAAETCVHCGGPAHEGSACAEDRETQMVLRMARRKGWKRCVGCGVLVMKAFGCARMTCVRCRVRWCYTCGGRDGRCICHRTRR